MSSFAAAKWMRNGNKTASVVAASATVHDQGAAASLATSSMDSVLTLAWGTIDGGRVSLTN